MHHALIFERFRQVESDLTIRKGGTGLGLSISRAFVEMMGGSIYLTSEPGKGSVFYVELPAGKETASGSGTEDSAPAAVPGSRLAGKILIAEDDELNYFYFNEIISASGYQTLRAKNGKEATDLVKHDPSVSLVLMDLKMPEMDGFSALKLIKEMRPGLPVIAQTAHMYNLEEKEKMVAGFDGFLTKPVSKAGLLKMFSRFLPVLLWVFPLG
jgi:CheY-like chemotaxis protein